MKRLSWSILMLLPVGVFAADIYRSVDENGQVIYSDLPSGGAERIAVETGLARAQVPSQAGADAADDDGAEPEIVAEMPREPTAAEIAEDRARNCQFAQDKVTTFSQAHRLFRNGPDGEREYLSDAEISEARAQAESDVAAWCD